MKYFILSTCIYLAFGNFTNAQTQCGIAIPQDSTNWGLGLIKASYGNPIKGIDSDGNTMYFMGDKVGTDKQLVNESDKIYAGFYQVFYKVYEIRNTKLKIFSNTIDEAIWVEFNDLIKYRCPFYTYYSFIYERDKLPVDYQKVVANLNFGVNLINSCLNLRSEGSTKGEIITCIKSNKDEMEYSQIDVIEERKGWAYVKYRKLTWYDDPGGYVGGCNYKIVRESYGWLKAIDDNGHPNIWFPLIRE